MKCYQIQIREPGMITIAKRYYLIKMRCLNKMLKCIASDLIYGLTLLKVVLKDLMIVKDPFIRYIGMCSRRLRLKRLELLHKGMICNSNAENMKDLEIQQQI